MPFLTEDAMVVVHRLKGEARPVADGLAAAGERWDDAWEALGRARRIDPENARAHYNLGRIYDRNKLIDSAIPAKSADNQWPSSQGAPSECIILMYTDIFVRLPYPRLKLACGFNLKENVLQSAVTT